MKVAYFTIDFEDILNPCSIKICGEIIKILSKYRIRPVVFISGDIIKLLMKNHDIFSDEIKTIMVFSDIGYHTITHFSPTPVQITDEIEYSIAFSKAYYRETQTFLSKKKKFTITDGFKLLFNEFPKYVRFPGFSWAPPYLECLSKIGIHTSFDIHPDGLSNLPLIFKKRKNLFIKPGCILWIDEIVRKCDNFGYAKGLVRKYINDCSFINIAVHPNRLCNKEWWLDYCSNPEELPRYSIKKIQKHVELLENIIQLLKDEIEVISIDKIVRSYPITAELKISEKEIRQIYANAIKWTVKRYGYFPKHLLHHFFKFFLE